jgi:hypothetical protein
MDEAVLYHQAFTVFESLWSEVVCNGWGGSREISGTKGVPVRRVALNCNIKYAGVNFADMVKELYSGELEEDRVISAWDKAADVMLGNTPNYTLAVVRELKAGLPRFDLTSQVHPYIPSVQFLKGVSFKNGYKLTNTKDSCLLETPSGAVIGIDRSALVKSTGGKRTRRKYDDLREPLELWRGRPTHSPHFLQTRASYLILAANAPRYGEVIDALFAIALEAGKEVEKALHHNIDFLRRDDGDAANKYTGPVLEAYSLVATAVTNPLPALRMIFSRHLTQKQFENYFGNTRQKFSTQYTESARQKDLRAIDRLSTAKVFEETGRKKDQVNNLLSTLFGI